MKTVLLAWELGAGFGHAASLRRIAMRLRLHGVRLIAVVRKPAAIGDHREIFDDISTAPPWPIDEPAIAPRPPGSAATMNDILSWAGLAETTAVQRILSAWDSILSRVRPDLVVADYAPLATLAVRGRIPLALVGNGFTVPPAEMPRFPLLHRLAPPAYDETETLANVDAAAAALGLQQIDRLPQLFSGDACLVQSFRLLDPYDTQRVAALQGPVFEDTPISRVPEAEQVFAYLSSDANGWTFLSDALVSVAKRLRIYAPLWPKAPLDRLAQAGARVETRPQPIAETLARSRLVVHLGGSGLAAEALAAGVPQLAVAGHIEQKLNGDALERAGVGRVVGISQPETRLEPGELQSLIDDDAMAARAAALGNRLRSIMTGRDALAHCEAICMDLLRASNP